MFKILRILQVINIIGKHRLDVFLPRQPIFLPLRILLRLIPSAWFSKAHSDSSKQIKNTIVELGPVFIKLGQMLSTRPDLLPEEIIQQLVELQDNVPPFEPQIAKKIIEGELGQSTDELFAEFKMQALASASIAQIHEAKLHSGEEVVVKVARPGIEKIIRRDFAVLEMLTRWLEQLWQDSRRLHINKIAQDYRYIMLAELDLAREASNTLRFHREFKNSSLLYVPDVCMDYCSRNVMVMERVHGIPVTDVETMKAKGVDIAKLAERGVLIFFTQVFGNNFFHADIHPGNVLVDISKPKDPRYISIDHAIVGSLSKEDQFFLARIVLAFLQRDFYHLTEILVKFGWLPQDAEKHEFAMSIQAIAEPIFDRPLDEINLAPQLLRVYQIFRRYRLELKPQFVLLEKTVLHIEGLGKQLYPSLDIWSLGQPLMEQWMKEQIGPQAVWRSVKQDFPVLVQQIPHLPLLVTDALAEIRQQSQLQKSLLQETQRHHKTLQKQRRADIAFLSTSAALFACAILLAAGATTAITQIPASSWVLGGSAVTLVLLRFLTGGRPS